ncbi:MAG: VanZ family protein [Clostridia bacterium]|nr:VanZ family protein [Clostridia bacterium]
MSKSKSINLKREAQLILVYICLIVVARFTFFPFEKLNGKIQPLILDAANIIPFRINMIPFVNITDYEKLFEAKLNIIGNTAMFIPIGIIWPIVYSELNTPAKAIGAGILFSLCIELLQLPFYDRVTDIDDLILNSLGFIIGYGIYCAVKAIKNSKTAA